MSTDACDVRELQNALNDASGKASVLWTTFLSFQIYLAIAFGSVTHRDLFLETPIKLPLLNADLPLVGFFVVAPTLLVIFHFYVFLQLFALTAKANDYDTLLRQEAAIAADRQYLRQRLDSFLVLQFLAGPAEQRRGFVGFSLRSIAWITLVGAPMLILLQAQVTFLPYHLAWVAWIQRIAVTIDLVVIWFFWNRIRRDDEAFVEVVSKKAWQTLGVALSSFVGVFSFGLATFPGEVIEHDSALRTLLIAGEPDELRGRQRSLFSDRLVLVDQSFVEPDKLDKVLFSHSFRGRNLEAAVLSRTDLRKADFTGAFLTRATLKSADLRDARLTCEDTNQATTCTQLQYADLAGARLEGALLTNAQLRHTDLSMTHFEGAQLDWADLERAILAWAQLQGADLSNANLEGAILAYAQLQGANLSEAHLEGALLRNANFEGADLSAALLQGADLTGAQLQGAALRTRKFPVRSFKSTEWSNDPVRFQGALLVSTKVWRAYGDHPVIDLARLDDLDTRPAPIVIFKNPEDLRPRYVSSEPQLQVPFSDWIAFVTKGIPTGIFREQAIKRLSVLDPAEPPPAQAIDEGFWKQNEIARKTAESQRELGEAIVALACSAPYVAHGLLRNGLIKNAGAQRAVIADKLWTLGQKADADPSACVLHGFTYPDWVCLRDIGLGHTSETVSGCDETVGTGFDRFRILEQDLLHD